MNISRIYRLLRIITLLQSERDYTAGQLAEELQISRRTVFRDFNVLEMARIPYYYDHESQSHRISRHFFMPPVNLTLSEALALLALAGTVQADSNVPLLSQSVQAAVKLESALPQSIREHVGSVIKSLTLRLAPMARHEGADQFFDMLSEAIVHRYICRMEYDSFYNGRTIKVEIQPFRQIFVHRAWYLLGWSVPEKALRTYKLVRIRSLNVTKRVFSEKREKELARHFDQAWTMIPEGKVYHVHLHFEPKVAGNVAEVQWHKTQRVEWNDDQSLEYHVEVDGLNEISWWILGYGDQVKVISPKPLCKLIIKTAQSVLKKYNNEKDG